MAEVITQQDIADYIGKNLKLDIKSKKVTEYDSKYEVIITLKLNGAGISEVAFTI